MPKRIWFLSAPLHGHIDWGGLLRTAKELVDRGHQVTWVSAAPIASAVAQAGVPFAEIAHTGWLYPLPPPADYTGVNPMEAALMKYRRALDAWLSEDLIGPAVGHICGLAKRIGAPDLMVSDPLLTAAALAAEQLNVPFVVAGYPAGAPLDADQMMWAQADLSKESRTRVARISEGLGLQAKNFSDGAIAAVQSTHMHLTYFSDTWFQGDGMFLPQTRHVGGDIVPPQGPPPGWLSDIPAETPLALVTLGSLFTGDLGFYAWAAQAAARAKILPIVVIGRNPMAPEQKDELKRALPRHTRLLSWVDFDHLFPRLKIIIHHGGMGTTHKAIVHGIPQVIVPHAADQRLQARRAAQAKVGLNLTAHDVRQGQLNFAVQAMLQDDNVGFHVNALAKEFLSLGGPKRGADLLLAI
jgi:MGT family glycosyltransferase